MPTPRTVPSSLFAFILLSLSAALPAQEASSNIGEAWVITVKSGQGAQFEAALKAHAQLRQERGEPRNWEVYTPVTGDQLNVYALRSCCFAWADQDTYAAWELQEMTTLMQDFNDSVGPHVAGIRHYFTRVDFANSHWPESARAAYVGVTTFAIETGGGADFAAARATISQVALNAGWAAAGHRWAWVEIIGGAPQVQLVVPYDNYAAMAPPPQSLFEFLAEKMGAEAAGDTLETLSDATAGSEYSIWRLRPDLEARE